MHADFVHLRVHSSYTMLASTLRPKAVPALARALGAEVTVFTTSGDKRRAAKELGAEHVELEADAKAQMQQMSTRAGTFDLILSSVPQKHDVNPFVVLLKRGRALVVVGALEPLAPVNNQFVAFHRRSVAGSLIGSVKEQQEVLDFCAEHGIAPDIEVIDIQDVNAAYKRVEDGDIHFRYVINMASLKREREEA